ncbi:hypothetical protein DPMN_013004 [Dreissena polymorpha]|uniref:Uncharacterized protein n=1 Tax=Dreissena polymorpha TaxID=45954 RepID=A0A9D4S1F9_DREPO|nr:hypothetical protein DPMN_013004 [Dreissena polymorpha]
MEWEQHAGTDVGGKIIQFMMEREYIPVMPLQRLVRLQAENRTTWPNDIMRIKNPNKVS